MREPFHHVRPIQSPKSNYKTAELSIYIANKYACTSHIKVPLNHKYTRNLYKLLASTCLHVYIYIWMVIGDDVDKEKN